MPAQAPGHHGGPPAALLGRRLTATWLTTPHSPARSRLATGTTLVTRVVTEHGMRRLTPHQGMIAGRHDPVYRISGGGSTSHGSVGPVLSRRKTLSEWGLARSISRYRHQR